MAGKFPGWRPDKQNADRTTLSRILGMKKEQVANWGKFRKIASILAKKNLIASLIGKKW